jgi:signal transduction histidine kinase
VTLWRRWRADLARPEIPTSRQALGFLVGTAVVIVVAAQLTDPGTALDLLALAPAVVAFVLRGLVPRLPAEVFAVMVIVPVAVAIGRDGALEGAFFLGVMMVFNTASQLGSLTRALVITGAAVALPWVVAEQLVPESGITWEPWVLANVFIFTLGRAVYRQGRLIEQLEQARRALADQEVAEERRRIARELHDLAGHTLAAMLLHVTGARHVLRRDTAEAERALIDAEMVGRASLDQIRATVASLRADERGTDPALAGVADIATLVDEYRRAGLVIESTVDESAAAVTGPLGVAVHRVAREALANVARHAPGNRVELRVDWMGDGVRLLVLDRGRPAAPPDGQGLHFGLVGMAERTRSLGGRFDAGPTSDGWRLEASFPNAVADHVVSS